VIQGGRRVARALAARPRLSLLIAITLAAMALRPQLIGVQPLLPLVQDDLETSHAIAGLLVTIIVACLGLLAPIAPFVSARLGLRRSIGLMLALIVVGSLARPFVPGIAGILLLTVPIGIGMGLGGALMPVLVKTWFADRAMLATGAYVSGIQLAQVVPAAIAVPIAEAAGSWRVPLFAFGVFTVLLLFAWLPLTRRTPADRTPMPYVRARLPLRVPVVWLCVIQFVTQGLVFYGLGSWLPDAYVERGWSEARAGALIAVLNAANFAASATVPILMHRMGSRRQYLLASAVLMIGGALGFVLAPGGAWAWCVVSGIALSTMFVVSLALPLDLTDRPAEVGAIVAMMLGIGYSSAAVAPFLLGAIRDATGSFTTSLWLIVGFSVCVLAVSVFLSPERISRGLRPAQ
jgi:CP family cyanate transporter-like MFS transporter